MCSSNNYQDSGLTKGQFLLSQINVIDAIRNEALRIKSYGFIPTSVVLADFLYQQLKKDFCANGNASFTPEVIELNKFDDLTIVRNGQERNFSFGGVPVLPMQISYTLPVDEVVEGDTSGEDNNEPMDQMISLEDKHSRLELIIENNRLEDEVSVETLVEEYRHNSSEDLQDEWTGRFGAQAAKQFVRHFGITAN